MCRNKQNSEHDLGTKYAKILNIANFQIWQGSQYALRSVLNMPVGFCIRQGSEYARVTQGFRYPTVWPNMSE